jgi:hypothetical protein
MRLFRSEEELPEPRGGVMPVPVLRRLAADWYGDRLDPGWRPRTRDQNQAILDRHGLTGPFWRLPARAT